ncbi:flagellar basal-body rod modification protein FlgD [Bradyrhizobium sp. LB1.3]|jgi:flagellar basal-body rod modification protein FlgD|uniref:flagellar hook assembly protein FlgD n=1 Tax=unclassified Bradyrhizobium TaxID=2631580 RepID=UPI001FF704D6|nr:MULTISPECIES: flagellar hook capping FlgD N-terminal domain-containing protein [unclassified Bradyrhizobium]MCK1340557.1 flagellar biosynthesis protein FlgD [Bradyrhizobium sp. 38]MCK1480106.1 flagellar biosynthesis protein FlgD [Bradyrhizobium sp. 197]MCK1777405.1 flagellar biosynthesis protein FlgD [Bradyrhizobium sp. 132]
MTTTTGATAPSVVSGTTDLTKSSTSSSSLGSTTGATLAGNFQTFLTLLTTQLQNQNPLDPLDTNQFTQQLVQFAGVEQQLKTNDSLSQLVTLQQTTQATQALGFVGKTALVDGTTASMTNSSATWHLNVPSDATVDITVANASGQTVFTGKYTAGAGADVPFTWSGMGNDGTQWPDGKYTISATGKDVANNNVGIAAQVQGTVSSVDLTQSPPLLTIDGASYTLSQVKSIIATASN